MANKSPDYAVCKQCGTRFKKGKKNQLFCKSVHRDNFHNKEKARLLKLGREVDAKEA